MLTKTKDLTELFPKPCITARTTKRFCLINSPYSVHDAISQCEEKKIPSQKVVKLIRRSRKWVNGINFDRLGGVIRTAFNLDYKVVK